MTSTVSLTPQQTQQVLEQAQAAAQAIANSATIPIGTNQFVFFAAFDGTDNAYVPVNGDTQDTAIVELFNEVKGGNSTFQTASYYAGVGTPGTLSGSDWWPSDVTAQNIQTAQDAYDNFALTAFNFLQANPGGSVTSMIAGFSRGCAAEAIFAQMLYKNGLVYTDQNGVAHTLIQPGAVGAVSAALAIDPVLTGDIGNMDFPPGVQNLTVIRSENEYRSLFTAADYGSDADTIIDAPGNHSDTGDAYDNGLGGIYLRAYTSFFQNAGLHTLSVDSARQFISPTATPLVVHSESLTDAQIAAEFALTGTLPAWEATYNPTNDLSVKRKTTSYGSPVTVSQSATSFTAYDGNIVIGGSGYTANTDSTSYVLLPDSMASIGGIGDTITINYGATLDFTSNVITTSETTIRFAQDSTKLTQNSTAIIDQPFAFRGTIGGFVPSDRIDLKGVGTVTGAALAANNVLTVQNGNGNTLTLQFDPTQNFSGDSFLIAPDGTGGSDITIESNTQPILFTGPDELLLLTNPNAFSGTIYNFLLGDTIDLEGISGASVSLGANNVPKVNQTGGGSLPIDFDPSQDLADGTFSVASDGVGGIDITLGGVSVTPISAPGSTFTVADGINDSGTTVGYFFGALGYQAFVESNNIFSTLNVPASAGSFTWFSDVNDGGQVSGQYFNNQSTYTPFVESGGLFNTFNVPGAKSAWTTGINDSGQVVGYAVTNLSQIFGEFFFSYLESGGGSTILNVPGSVSTKANGINDAGDIVGTYFNATGGDHGFLYRRGVFNTIDISGATSTELLGINNLGQIVGEFSDGQGSSVFTLTGTTLTTINFPGSDNIGTLGINDSGQIVGYEYSTSGNIQGSFLVGQAVACFVIGTHIETLDRGCPVEDLAIGDLVRTGLSGVAPVTWIGRRHVDCSHHPEPRKVWPVRVRADAFGEGLPHRDLWLSPDHAVYVNDVLIPVKHLINGMTIEQVPVDELTYYHIELEQHDVVLAERLPTESYLDTGDRSKFTNCGSVVALHPDFSARMWEANGCAPLVVTGPILAAVRARLLQRAAKLASQPRPSVRTSCAA